MESLCFVGVSYLSSNLKIKFAAVMYLFIFLVGYSLAYNWNISSSIKKIEAYAFFG